MCLKEMTCFCPVCGCNILQIPPWVTGPGSVSLLSLCSLTSSLGESGTLNFSALRVDLSLSTSATPSAATPSVEDSLFKAYVCQDSSVFSVAPVMARSNCPPDSVETFERRVSKRDCLDQVGMSGAGGGAGVVFLCSKAENVHCFPQLRLYNNRESNLSNEHALLCSLSVLVYACNVVGIPPSYLSRNNGL